MLAVALTDLSLGWVLGSYFAFCLITGLICGIRARNRNDSFIRGFVSGFVIALVCVPLGIGFSMFALGPLSG